MVVYKNAERSELSALFSNRKYSNRNIRTSEIINPKIILLIFITTSNYIYNLLPAICIFMNECFSLF